MVGISGEKVSHGVGGIVPLSADLNSAFLYSEKGVINCQALWLYKLPHAGSINPIKDRLFQRTSLGGLNTLKEFRPILASQNHRIDAIHSQCIAMGKRSSCYPQFTCERAKLGSIAIVQHDAVIRRQIPIKHVGEGPTLDGADAKHL